MPTDQISVSVSIDTEEDNWGTYRRDGATTRNIEHLPELQELFDKWEVRPTYLVNLPPLQNAEAVAVLGALAQRESVEIGTHCHPWNTPPFTGEGVNNSMMFSFTREENRAKIRTVHEALERELGVSSRCFRAGRWGVGPTVAHALADEGYGCDCSVTPFIDWRYAGGPDFREAPFGPYRFDPADPLVPVAEGSLLQLPPTIGFLRGDQRHNGRVRNWAQSSLLARIGVVGIMDRLGFGARRWLSPETSAGSEMIRLSETLVASGERFLHMVFHSSALLVGATPFVATRTERRAFMASVEQYFEYASRSGFSFRTLSEVAEVVSLADRAA